MTTEPMTEAEYVNVVQREAFQRFGHAWAARVIVALRACAEAPAPESKRLIEHMVNRFLAWRLPEDFNPDGGINFTRDFNEHTAYPMKHEPTGTNLFTATQAEVMVRHLLGGDPEGTTTTKTRPIPLPDPLAEAPATDTGEEKDDQSRSETQADRDPLQSSAPADGGITTPAPKYPLCKCGHPVRDHIAARTCWPSEHFECGCQMYEPTDALAPPEPCVWTLEDEDGSAYQTSCGNMFEFNDGGPVENKAKFCQYCGKPLEVCR